MSGDLIEKTLKTAVEAKDIVFGDGVTSQTGEMFVKLFPRTEALVAADENTFGATDEEVVTSLKAAGIEFAQEPYIFPGKPTLYGDYKDVEILHKHTESLEDTIVCLIGMSTFNDITELAPGELNRPYMNVYATASVDGFAAFGASISRDGFKIARSCPDPAGLVAGNDVVCNAPKRLTATGYSGLIERIPAGADWILADALGIEPTNECTWNMVQGPLHGSLTDPEAVRNGDEKAIEGLMEGNLMSGLATRTGQSSCSTSGAGRQFSHVWEMEGHGPDWGPPLSHGLRVRVETVASCVIWEEFLRVGAEDFGVDRAFTAIKSPKQVESQVRAALKSRMQEEAVRHSLKKRTKGEEPVARTELPREKQPELRERLCTQLMVPEEVMSRLKTVDAPYHPELIEIGWDRFREIHFKARTVRGHYAVFDILIDLGVYDAVVEKLFSPEGL